MAEWRETNALGTNYTSARSRTSVSEFPCGSSWTDRREPTWGHVHSYLRALPRGGNVTYRWIARSPSAEGGLIVAIEVQPQPHQGSCRKKSSVGTPPKHPFRERASNCAPATSEEVIKLQTAQPTKSLFHESPLFLSLALERSEMAPKKQVGVKGQGKTRK